MNELCKTRKITSDLFLALSIVSHHHIRLLRVPKKGRRGHNFLNQPKTSL